VLDPRAERLAELVAGYSLDLGPGDVLRIDASDVASPFVRALYGAAVRRGANAYAALTLDGVPELLVEQGSEEQIAFLPPHMEQELDTIDALVTVWSMANVSSFTQLDPERHGRYIASRRRLSNRFFERVVAGDARWVGTLFPTEAHAQAAEMSLTDYEQFVYGACHVLAADEDAAEHWRSVSAELRARAAELEQVRELRIVGPGTDLRLGVHGRRWQASDGRLNMPDGELFTSPVEDETEGEIRFAQPVTFQGRAVEDVRLRFERGRIIEAEARAGRDYLESMLGLDDGARYLGECSFGLNYEIDRFTGDTLLDEKLGGTVHVALGSGFKHLGGVNDSALHWDMVCDLRHEGEVYADGALIWSTGSFVREPEPAANRA
jgi:aminopeptidase